MFYTESYGVIKNKSVMYNYCNGCMYNYYIKFYHHACRVYKDILLHKHLKKSNVFLHINHNTTIFSLKTNRLIINNLTFATIVYILF